MNEFKLTSFIMAKLERHFVWQSVSSQRVSCIARWKALVAPALPVIRLINSNKYLIVA